jgi:protein HOOK3
LQEKKRLEARLSDVLTDLEETREKCTALEDELAESKYALDRRGRTTVDDKNLAQLNQRADRDKEYIAELESDLANSKTAIEQHERQLERLKADTESKQELRDELQLITAERDDLRQKSKANENLKKKIQALQEQEKSSASLRLELQNAQDQLQDLEDVQERCAALEKANEENAQTIANGEQEIFDQKTAKRRLEHELKVVAQKWEQTRDLLSNAQESIRDLEDKIHDGQSTEGREGALDTLDDELNAETGAAEVKDKDLRYDLCFSFGIQTTDFRRRRKPKEPTTTAEGIVLQQSLNIANASIARLEQRCLDLLQENLGFKSIIDDVEDAKRTDLHPFHHQARKLETVSRELDEVKSKFITASGEVTDLSQRLAAAAGKGTAS